MAQEQDPGVADDDDRPKKPSETLSQFVARVLGQLSLVAWLPSGALVLSLTFVFQFNAVLDGKVRPKDTADAIGDAFSAMTRIGFSGALLLFAAVIVLTILTQAFAFGALLALQGFWGALPLVEWVAKHRCKHFDKKRKNLEKRYENLTEEAWYAARSEIEKQQAQAIDRHDDDVDVLGWTPNMLSYLDARLTGRTPGAEPTVDERQRARDIPWKYYASSDLLRRRANLETRLDDFPESRRTMPTQLGNVLRFYTDQIEQESVETFVLEVYDRLPPYLRAQHDEQRNRLYLYCSMVLVIALIIVVTIALLGLHHLGYAISAIVLGVTAMWLTYRAAIATARVYGLYLRSISKWILATEGGADSER